MIGSIFKNKKIQYLILEKGSLLIERSADKPEDIMSGVDGGELFADGKLSFPPSASNLWKSLPSQEVKKAYDVFAEKMHDLGVNVPPWKEKWNNSFVYEGEYKKYESI